MLGSVLFIFAVASLDFASSRRFAENVDLHRPTVIHVQDPKDNRSTCSIQDAVGYYNEFHECFTDRKYRDGGKDLNNIVDRILEHSRVCAKNSTRECRPNYEGFTIIMDKIIAQMKDYCYIYLELISHGRNNIKDLECVETSLSNETYHDCFKEVFVEGTYTSEAKFQKKIEKAISCTNKHHKLCSKDAKTSLNRMVRTILRVKQPEREDIEDDVKPKPPMRWYDYIFQPFISLWKSITSFFGF